MARQPSLTAFVDASASTDDELHALLQTIIARLMKLLTRRAVLVEEMGQTYPAEPDVDCEEACTLRPLQAAAVSYPRMHWCCCRAITSR